MTRMTRRDAEIMLAELRGEQRILDRQVQQARKAVQDYLAGR